MIALAALAVLMVIPVWCALRYEAPGPVTPLVGVRYLLMCCACLLLSLVARQDPLPGPMPWAWGLAGSVVATGVVVVVVWWEAREGEKHG